MSIDSMLKACVKPDPPVGTWLVLLDAVEQYGVPPEEWWGLLVDAAEDTGKPAEAWLNVLDLITNAEETRGFNTRRMAENAAARQLFHGLALHSYPYAVDLLQTRSGEQADPRLSAQARQAAVDGMNTAHCRAGAEWESVLDREKMEWLVGEVGNLEKKPLGYRELREIEPDDGAPGYAQGHADRLVREAGEVRVSVDDREFLTVTEERHYALWMDHAPEWLQHDLEAEHADGASFLTTWSSAWSSPEFMLIDDEVWERVRDGAHTPETECPIANWDPEHHEDAQNRLVTLEDTYCGERPGETCRYCTSDLGERHGMVYMGEGGESVYLRLTEEAGGRARREDEPEPDVQDP